MWTSLKLIEWTQAHFQKKGIPNPRLDAELLLASTLSCKRLDLYLQYNKPLRAKELSEFRAAVKRRAAREPLQYILGETEFYGLKIKVTPDVLIPRPETELLVETVLGGWRKETTGPLLEIGTGSGCIAIALAKHLHGAEIDATERSAAALAIARDNIAAHGLAKQITLYEADLFPPHQKQYDLIVTNPPYIPTEQLGTLQPEVGDWEPRAALDGGLNGLEVYGKIVAGLTEWLAPGGHFIGEIGSEQKEAIQSLFEQAPCFESIKIKNDLAGLPRIVIARKIHLLL